MLAWGVRLEGDVNLEVADLRFRIGEICRKLGFYTDALEQFRHSLETRRRLLDEEDELVGDTEASIALVQSILEPLQGRCLP